MKATTQEKLNIIRGALTKDALVFVRVAGREYGISAVRTLQHNLELELAGDRHRMIVAPEELGAVRIFETGHA